MRAVDGVGREGVSAVQTVVADRTAPTVTLALSESSPYAHVRGDAAYYGVGDGVYTVTATLADGTAGLAEVVFPATTGPGAAYGLDGITATVRSHAYAFTAASTFDGAVSITATDRADNASTVVFTVARDATPPVAQVVQAPQYTNVAPIGVEWAATDDASGVQGTALWVRFEGGTWQEGGLAAQPGVAGRFDFTPAQEGRYEFAVAGTDNVNNREGVNGAEGATVYDVTPPTATLAVLAPYQTTRAFTVTWVGADNLSGIGGYDVQYQAGGGWQAWQTDTPATSGAFAGEEGRTYSFRVRARDRATNAGAWGGVVSTTVDTLPPTSSASSPATSESATFAVTWGGSDATSGVAFYDLEVQVDGGEWQRVLTRTQSTGYQFTGALDHTYGFRVRAWDVAGNVEAWPAGADTVTRVVRRVVKYYYHGGARVALRTSGAGGSVVYWLHGDHLGSVSLVTDHASRVVAQQRFLPYGGVRYSEGTFPTDVGFTGHRGHPALGLVYMRARYYHVALGRFVSADTVVPSLSNPQDFGRYTYARNSPILYNDPDGHCPLCVALGLVVVAFLVAGCSNANPAQMQTAELPRGGGHYEVHHYPDRVEVNADIQIYGEGASPEVARTYEQDIERVWNNGKDGTNVTYGDLPVVFDVNVYYKEPEAGWRRDLLSNPVRPRRGEADAPNMIFVEPGVVPIGLHPYLEANDGSYDWDWGVWWADMGAALTAHEAGHIFGLPDYYGDDGRPIDMTHYNWIMANPNGLLRPGTGEVDEIINKARYRYYHQK